MKIFAAEQAGIPKSLLTSALADQRKILGEQIRNWESVRLVYMPGILQIQTDSGLNPVALWSTNPNPEDVPLWLPSSLAKNQRRAACAEGLPEMELQLRTAQCSSSLEGLRRALRVKTRMIFFKNKNIRGQRDGTRSRSIIDRVHKRAIRFVQKYRAARQAKLNLEGPGEWETIYQPLQNQDVRGFATGKKKQNIARRGIWEDGHAPVIPEEVPIPNEESDDSDPDLNENDEPQAGNRLSKKKRKRGTGETRKEISWIWQGVPTSFDDDESNELLRAEWARSRARVRRTKEEVALLLEEMRRVCATLEWKATEWDSRQEARPDAGMDLREGIRAYALEQAALQRMLSSSFQLTWKMPLASVEKMPQERDIPDPTANQPAPNGNVDEDEDDDGDDGPEDDEVELEHARHDGGMGIISERPMV